MLVAAAHKHIFQVEDHVNENKQLPPLTILFSSSWWEHCTWIANTKYLHTFWAYAMFHKQAFVSTYVCKQTKIEKTVGLLIWKQKSNVFAAEHSCTL